MVPSLRHLGGAVVSVSLVLGALPATAPARTLDRLLPKQWPLAVDGPLGAPAGWRASSGAGVVVAVLDTGVDATHPDLRDTLWTNPGEVPGNGVDDDRDGHVDDVHGTDLVDGDGDPADAEGHGTHVAGIIAAGAGDGGVLGLAPGAQVMAVRVLDDRRAGDAVDVARGIRYALSHGAQVINTSINGDVVSSALRDALRAASVAGVPVVASAGNDGRDIDARPSYPASYPELSVISVAATDRSGAIASFSNTSATSVDLAAPGEQVLSTRRGGGHEWRSGTSMAAPHVAGALALLRAADPARDLVGLRAALDTGAALDDTLTGKVRAGALRVDGALRAVLGDEAFDARALKLTARVKRRARRRVKTQVTWSLAGAAPDLARFVVRDTAGNLLGRRSADGRSAWVKRRRGTVVVNALDAAGAIVATTRLRLTR